MSERINTHTAQFAPASWPQQAQQIEQMRARTIENLYRQVYVMPAQENFNALQLKSDAAAARKNARQNAILQMHGLTRHGLPIAAYSRTIVHPQDVQSKSIKYNN